jgi:hypothetical protein
MKTLYSFFIIAILGINATQAQVPMLNSYAASRATVFLDFDGHTVAGTSWNWNGPFYCLPAGLSAAAVNEIFTRVAEDFRPFNLNITTDSADYLAAPVRQRIRMIITPTSNWYGPAGGVSYVGSFTWGDGTPGFIFNELLGNNAKYISEAMAHEIGHTLGLQHQSTYDANCNRLVEYSGGQGNGEISWAPIMGVGYYKNVTTWHLGPNAGGCNTIQNDMNVIAGAANGFGYRTDDHENVFGRATDVVYNGLDFTANGIINNAADVDVFKFTTAMPTRLLINAVPLNVGAGNDGADVDIKLSLLDNNGDTIAVYNPSTLLSAGIDTNINSGNYYMVVDGVGNINHTDYGSVGYYMLNGSFATALPVQKISLKGLVNNNSHVISWVVQADEPISNYILQSSVDGKIFNELMNKKTDERSFINYTSSNTYYRLKAVTARGQFFYSNIILLKNNNKQTGAAVISATVHGELQVSSDALYNYRIIDAGGKLLSTGQFLPGVQPLPLPAAKGFMILQWHDVNGMHSHKLIKQ